MGSFQTSFFAVAVAAATSSFSTVAAVGAGARSRARSGRQWQWCACWILFGTPRASAVPSSFAALAVTWAIGLVWMPFLLRAGEANFRGGIGDAFGCDRHFGLESARAHLNPQASRSFASGWLNLCV